MKYVCDDRDTQIIIVSISFCIRLRGRRVWNGVVSCGESTLSEFPSRAKVSVGLVGLLVVIVPNLLNIYLVAPSLPPSASRALAFLHGVGCLRITSRQQHSIRKLKQQHYSYRRWETHRHYSPTHFGCKSSQSWCCKYHHGWHRIQQQ